MRRLPSVRGFTLIELVTVLGVIIILAGLVLSLSQLVRIKGRRAQAQVDRMALAGACEAYKTDNGGYPQDASGTSVTDSLDPRANFNPSSSATPSYAASSLFLYQKLTGDVNANGRIDAGETAVPYGADFFKPLKFDQGYKTKGTISYIADPFGYSYGYSTAGLKAEQDYRVQLQTNPAASRPAPSRGYNSTFDLWSTSGSVATTSADQAKWIKNW